MLNLKAILEKTPEGATHYTDGAPTLNIYVKVVHLDGCYLHLGGKWERCPTYAGLKCLDDLRRTLELQDERDAYLAELQKANAVIIDLQRNPPKLLENHLRQVRADAGRAGFIKGYDYASYGSHPEDYADQYADSIRQEGK